MFGWVLSHGKHAPPVGEGYWGTPAAVLAHAEQMFKSEQVVHPEILHKIHVLFPAKEYELIHWEHTFCCWHIWQFVIWHSTQVFGALRVYDDAQLKQVDGFAHI